MKLQLDTINKTIKIEDNVSFQELIDVLEKLLPKGEWKKFTLETSTVINNWSSPIIIEKTVPRYPSYPWYCANTTRATEYNLDKGQYNIEC